MNTPFLTEAFLDEYLRLTGADSLEKYAGLLSAGERIKHWAPAFHGPALMAGCTQAGVSRP